MPKHAAIIKTARGRLGNKLLPAISITAVAIELDLGLTNLTLGDDAQHFEHHASSNGVLDAIRWRGQRLLQQSGLVGTTIKAPNGEPFVRLPPSDGAVDLAAAPGPLFFIGHRFYNPVGIHRHHDELIRRLAPVERHRADIAAFARSLPRGRLCVALHIRDTDFRTYAGGRLHTPIERYLQAAGEIHERFGGLNPQFHVFSDADWPAETFEGLDAVVHRGSAIVDLFSLAWCDLVVSTASTFGLCGALLGDSCVYALNTYFHDALTPEGSREEPRHSASTLDAVERYIARADPAGVRAAADTTSPARPRARG